MKAPDQQGCQFRGQIRTFHLSGPGLVAGKPSGPIEILRELVLEGAVTQDRPDRRRQTEDVGAGRGHPAQMTLGCDHLASGLIGIERRPGLGTRSESNELRLTTRLHEDVVRIDATMDDPLFVGVGQPFRCADRDLHDGGDTRILEFTEMGAIDEPRQHGDVGGTKTLPTPLDSEGRADARIRESGEHLVLVDDLIEQAALRILPSMLEHHQVASLLMGGQEHASVGIGSQPGDDPESVLELAGSQTLAMLGTSYV